MKLCSLFKYSFKTQFSVCPEWSTDASLLVTFTGEEDKFGQVYTQIWVDKGALRSECGYDPEKQERQITIILEHFSPVERDSYEGDELIFGSTEETDLKEVPETKIEDPTVTIRTVDKGNQEETFPSLSPLDKETKKTKKQRNNKETKKTKILNEKQRNKENKDSQPGTNESPGEEEDDPEDPDEASCQSIDNPASLYATAFKGPEKVLKRWREYEYRIIIEDQETKQRSDPLTIKHNTFFWKCEGSCHKIQQSQFCNNERDCPDGSDESEDNCEVSQLPQKVAYSFYGTVVQKSRI